MLPTDDDLTDDVVLFCVGGVAETGYGRRTVGAFPEDDNFCLSCRRTTCELGGVVGGAVPRPGEVERVCVSLPSPHHST